MSSNSNHSVTDHWFLTGATASGKTSVALELATRINAEVISLDSMAVYRGMNIGTAKPTGEQRAAVPHYLVDILDPDQQFSVADYVDLAFEKIEEIRARGREVLFVGGTPLYLKAMLRGIFDGPPADWKFRREIEHEIEQVGLPALHDRLMQVDPVTANRLHPNDKRRMIRALEVYRITGEPISHQQIQFDDGPPAEQCRVFALQWPRDALHRRIESRVDQMFELGFVDEVNGLLEKYGELSHTASQAVGYHEVIEYIREHGDLANTIESVKVRTRRFARRQETWFRSLSECRFIEQHPTSSPAQVAEQIVALAGSGAS